MKKFALVLLLVNPAYAADVALQLNGASQHEPGCSTCNEDNEGLGFEIREDDNAPWIDVYSAGTLINSMRDRSYYAGMAKAYRLGKPKLNLSVGAFLGLVYYPTATDTNGIVPAILPFASLELGFPRINALYIPPVTEDVTGAVFVQLVMPLYQR